jgi:hypothetical protein
MENERGVLKKALSILALGRPSDPLLFSARHQHTLSRIEAATYDSKLHALLEGLLQLDDEYCLPAIVFFADDFTRASFLVRFYVIYYF